MPRFNSSAGSDEPSLEDRTPPASRWTRALVTLALVMPFVVVASAWLWGSRLPAERQERHSAAVEASPAEVAALLGDAARQPAWWPRVEKIEPIENTDRVRQIFVDGRSAHLGIASGADAGTARSGIGPAKQGQSERVVWTIADPAGPYRGTWQFEIVADANGSRVVLEEDARLGNAFARLLIVWRGGGGGMAEDCLRALADWGTRGR